MGRAWADALTLQQALDERRETRRADEPERPKHRRHQAARRPAIRPLERGEKDVFPSIEDIRPKPDIFLKIRRFGVLS
jgi:hypothetical protein